MQEYMPDGEDVKKYSINSENYFSLLFVLCVSCLRVCLRCLKQANDICCWNVGLDVMVGSPVKIGIEK